jgi:hypothetical protein
MAWLQQLSCNPFKIDQECRCMTSWQRWYCSFFKPPSEAARQRWQKTRARGKRSFALRWGAMGFGGLMFTSMIVMHSLIKSPFSRGMTDFDYGYIVINLLWPLAGYRWGVSMWRFYEEYFSDRNAQPPTSRT